MIRLYDRFGQLVREFNLGELLPTACDYLTLDPDAFSDRGDQIGYETKIRGFIRVGEEVFIEEGACICTTRNPH